MPLPQKRRPRLGDMLQKGSIVKQRLKYALPSKLIVIFGPVLWGGAMAASCWIGLYLRNRGETDHFWQIIFLYFAGAFIAFMPAFVLARFLSFTKPATARFCAYALSLCLVTYAVTAFIFAMQYRIFYAQWHEPFLSKIWFFQQLFTLIGATYQFTIIGLWFYFPIGILSLFITSFILSLRMR